MSSEEMLTQPSSGPGTDLKGSRRRRGLQPAVFANVAGAGAEEGGTGGAQHHLEAGAPEADRAAAGCDAHPGRAWPPWRKQNSEAAKVRIGAIKTELDVLDKTIAEWNTKALPASQKDAEYQRLKDALNRTTASYDKLVGLIDQMDMSRKAPGAVQIEKMATPPEKVDPGHAETSAHWPCSSGWRSGCPSWR